MKENEFIEKFLRAYERYIAPVTFTLGFILDTFTLRRIDLLIDHVIILGYLATVLAGITILTLSEEKHFRHRFFYWILPFIPVVVQFGFGGLFSAFIIFYTKGGSIAKSWLFIIVLAFFLIGNERFRRRYELFTFRTSVLFIAIFSYLIFAIPLLIGRLGTFIFLLTSVVALCVMAFFLFLLSRGAKGVVLRARTGVLWNVGTMVILFNVLYFTNVIPPLPLSMKEDGIYHSLTDTGSAYQATYEKAPWYMPFEETSRIFHWTRGERVYFFGSVFAPRGFEIPIVQRWSYFDEISKKWIVSTSVRFSIRGGRDGGYRGYSFKDNIVPGTWRIEVLTDGGQVIGRKVFRVVEASHRPNLEHKIK